MTGSSASERKQRLRHIPLPGTYNVRDLSGYRTRLGRTRNGMLLRGDSLHRLDAEGRQMLARIGLRTVIDLRDADERERYPSAGLGDDVRLVVCELTERSERPPALAAGWTLADAYTDTLRQRGPQLVGVVRELCTPGAMPALVHCMAGKDRTGVVSALVLLAIGVPEETVLEDFGASSLFLGSDYRREATVRIRARGFDEQAISRILDNDPEHLRLALVDLRERHGDVATYLLEHGLTQDELDALTSSLIEPESSLA